VSQPLTQPVTQAVTTAPGSPRPIRVLHVLNTLQTGGAEYLVLNIAKVFDRARFELLVASMEGDGEIGAELRAAGVPTFTLHRRKGLDATLVPKLVALCRRQHIDVVHTHNVAPWLYAGLAGRLAGAAVCHTEHSNLFTNQRALKRAERLLGFITRAVICDGEDVRRQLIEEQGLSPRNVVTIYNGVDTRLYGQAQGSRAALRSSAGLPQDARVVGTVARLEPVKDQSTLLRAFTQVAAAEPSARLCLIGDGSQRAALEAQAAAPELAGRVVFLGRRADVASLLPLFDVFALSSTSEGLPLTILEAMAAGLPVVSTAVGAIPEVIVQGAGETGLLCPPADPARLGAALLALVRDVPRARAMGQAGQRRARALFDLREMTRRYEDLWAAV
jgi:glycosyltransferase involved in cell wall biosynthesis